MHTSYVPACSFPLYLLIILLAWKLIPTLATIQENHARMQEWLDDNPRGKHGKHEYSLEQYGLTEEDVVRAFLPYYQRFYPKELERMGYQSGERDAPASRL